MIVISSLAFVIGRWWSRDLIEQKSVREVNEMNLSTKVANHQKLVIAIKND